MGIVGTIFSNVFIQGFSCGCITIKPLDKLVFYKRAVLLHSIAGLAMFCALIPSLTHMDSTDNKQRWLQADVFMGFFVIAAGFFVPITFIQNLLKKDLIAFDTFANKVRRENVYQTALAVPSGLISNIIVNIITGVIQSTGYSIRQFDPANYPKDYKPTITDLYSWNHGTIIQCAAYVLSFSFLLGLLSYWVIKDYPLSSVLAKKMGQANDERDLITDAAKVAKESSNEISSEESVEQGISDIYPNTASVKDNSSVSSGMESLEVSILPTAAEEEVMMLHLSNLECTVISESTKDAMGENEGLANIRKSAYFAGGVLGPLSLTALTVAGVHQLKDGLPFTQIDFTFILVTSVYLAYELSRISIIHKLRVMHADDVKDMAIRQVQRNKAYNIDLASMLKANNINEDELDGENDGDIDTFARMTFSTKASRKSIIVPVEEEKEDDVLSGYKRIYAILIVSIITGVLLTLENANSI